METIMESTKIGEGNGDDEVGSGDEGKREEAERTGEESGGGSTRSSAWPWVGSGKSSASSLTVGKTVVLFILISRLSLLRERLSLR